jgi:hypothetical protein
MSGGQTFMLFSSALSPRAVREVTRLMLCSFELDHAKCINKTAKEFVSCFTIKSTIQVDVSESCGSLVGEVTIDLGEYETFHTCSIAPTLELYQVRRCSNLIPPFQILFWFFLFIHVTSFSSAFNGIFQSLEKFQTYHAKR